MYVEHQIINFY